MKVGLVSHPIYLEHDTGQHMENARRLVETLALLEKTGLNQQLIQVQPEPASVDDLSLVHSPHYIKQIQNVAQTGGGWLDPDTVMSPFSYEAAIYAAGGVIKAAREVMDGNIDSAFVLARPPGHHARQNNAMGFCLFNNIAIAARRIMEDYKLDRVLIADFDVHHGNGTEETFYKDPGVLYFSTHQYPFYPGTGRIEEIGAGEGKGYTVNVPLPALSGDEEYLQIFREILVPLARRYQPQFILISAGYDAHWSDHISMMQMTITGFAVIAKMLKDLSLELCQGRLAFTLEGGYQTQALSYSIKATLEVLLGKTEFDDPLGNPQYPGTPRNINEIIQQVSSLHHLE